MTTRRYTGPARPVRTEYFNPVGLAWRIALLLFFIAVLALDLFYWRPG